MLDKHLALDYNKITENEQMFGGGKTMTFGAALLTTFEMAMVGFVIYAVFNEHKFVKFEERIAARFRRRKFKVIKGGNNVSKSYYPVNDRHA